MSYLLNNGDRVRVKETAYTYDSYEQVFRTYDTFAPYKDNWAKGKLPSPNAVYEIVANAYHEICLIQNVETKAIFIIEMDQSALEKVPTFSFDELRRKLC